MLQFTSVTNIFPIGKTTLIQWYGVSVENSKNGWMKQCEKMHSLLQIVASLIHITEKDTMGNV
jgi:hypothetical protein